MKNYTALEKFQASHLNHLGQQLGIDNNRGKQTIWAEHLATHLQLRQDIVARAMSFIGVCEEPMGSNRGDLIDQWLAACGLRILPKGVWAPDYAWCAAFASECLSVPGMNIKRCARVKDLVAQFEPVSFDLVLPGDLGYKMNEDGEHGHVWIISGREGMETMQIEGNTGNKVAVTRRGVHKYVRTVPAPIMPGIPLDVPMADPRTR
jgi:hypothetical protein